MDVSQFDFDLPDDLIALRPASPRDSARMLVVDAAGALHHASVSDLPHFLRSGDIVVVNDTRVVPARLKGYRLPRDAAAQGGPKVEILLHRRTGPSRFLAFARPARKLLAGDSLALGRSIAATVAARGEAGEVELAFADSGAALDAKIAQEGEMPLPPYIAGKRKADSRDSVDYQTMFAAHEGSVAAPTAGLHFTPTLLDRLKDAAIERETVTLHVGAGTFLPVTVSDTGAHRMHPEWATLSAEGAAHLNAVRAHGGRIVAVGTTVLRTLESAAAEDGHLGAFEGETSLFITPGYRFRTAEILLTNFHLPRSTLFMLVSAFCGLDAMKRAYREAIERRYRFYSYGDACLLFRAP